ncbi:unnamed protein product [Adineta steineri]|uniref:Uncharacterized protein n=1 Tax=Adineta steineri TaxID=433720 RepID=A0A814RQQ6_9BILA|nr:unnamed protein product [Adineta steineri]CAF1284218.1 unnamed protein product [Adineta steineri]
MFMNRSLITVLFFMNIQARIFLFDTEDSRRVEQHDCLYYTSDVSVKYCRRSNNGSTLDRSSFTCFNGGEQLSFQYLLEQNISPQEILQWNSSIERADDYASFFYYRDEKNLMNDEFLCHCIHPGTFGKYCEYHFLDGALTFEQSIKQQFEQKEKNHWAAQHYGDILCYKTIPCYSGLLCLDWRNICDGEQQCSGGYDEENCDLLEFNECDDDEYRCMNGMCIPEDYWLDGDSDCMDGSDEKTGQLHNDCFYQPDQFRCDEKFCSRGQWSCGDGQCIEAWNRFGYQQIFSSDDYCLSHRELNHMCEANWRWPLWTLSQTGLCTNQFGYDDPELSMSQTSSSSDERCTYLIRCALSQGFERDCVCNHLNCSQLIIDQCGPGPLYAYPNQALVRPYMFSLYEIDRSWLDRTPDQYLFDGEILCRGYYGKISVLDSKGLNINFIWIQQPHIYLDFEFCRKVSVKNLLEFHFDIGCWANQTLTFNKRSYAFDPRFCPNSHRCLSQYRSRDRISDCYEDSDEDESNYTELFCKNIRNHRLSCSRQEPYCISIHLINIANGICSDGYDRYLFGSDRDIKHVFCLNRNDQDCQLLRDYIRNSSIRNMSSNIQSIQSRSRLRYHWYCDSFWDTPSHSDESVEFCQSWICPKNQYQCQTGQCIQLQWLCDGEWDCSDASDEEVLLSIMHFSEHNQKLDDFSNRIIKCYQKYSNQSFSKICNISSELPCFRANVSDPLNINESRPCIPFNRVGDGYEDCVAGHDEKNTAVHCLGSMLGFNVRGNDGTCYAYKHICSLISNDPNWRTWCFYRNNNSSSCSNKNDVICLDGSCRPNARCNKKLECTHGEDEYRCILSSLESESIQYRWEKESARFSQEPQLQLNLYPSLSTIESIQSKTKRLMIMEEENAFMCNRGVTIGWMREYKVCFCPPTYYGKYCQFYNDRLTIITHLNLSVEMSHLMFKVIVTLHESDIDIAISHYQFIVNGTFERQNYVKHRFTLLFSRLTEMLRFKQIRYFTRSNILENQPYSIHFNLFQLNSNEIIELGRWTYPIYFDFLPSFRLVKFLSFPDEFLNQTNHSCINHSCPSNSICLPIINQQDQYYCSWQNGTYDANQSYEPLCISYCSSNSFCKPEYRGFLSNLGQPFCVCPLGYFGPRCNLRHEECHSQPCFNNGTCYLTYDSTGENPFRCECETNFYGDRCQWTKSFIGIDLNMTDHKAIISVVQFCDVFRTSYEILVQDQQLINGIPLTVSYNHPSIKKPILGILKTYEDLNHLNYFIIYFFPNTTQMYMISTPQQCPHVMVLLNQKPFDNQDGIPILFKYHRICQYYKDLYCFYNDDYLCICELDHHRANCLLHDINIDRCNYCFSNGKCLRGSLKDEKNFFCICPRCYQGDRCQFSMEAFGSTIDSLLSSHSLTISLIYIIISGYLLFIGLINNICSFVTFQRSTPRKVAIGYFLLISTLLNKFSIFFLFLKFLYNFIGSAGWFNDDRLNLVLCKMLSYFLSVTTRSFYWLASWITINRLFIILCPTKTFFKRPSMAKIISSITIFLICLMHCHEILSHIIIKQSDSTVCVTHFEGKFITNYNRVTTFIHYLIPVAIQIISITLLIFHVARSRTRSRGNAIFSRSFLTEQFLALKELYITPLAIAISALPQITLSFTLACQQLVQWQKHLLLCAYLLSYTPQILAFCLFVLPSTIYKQEFSQTWIGQKLSSRFGKLFDR